MQFRYAPLRGLSLADGIGIAVTPDAFAAVGGVNLPKPGPAPLRTEGVWRDSRQPVRARAG
ncbi:MAG: hypothetical protein ABIV50_11100 [Opitutus sp.]